MRELWTKRDVSRSLISAAVVGGLLAVAIIRPETANGQREQEPEFRPVRVAPTQRAITNPSTVTAREIGDRVTDRELVLGVVVDGDARAYPINMLTGPRREIINDTLGGRAIAATW